MKHMTATEVKRGVNAPAIIKWTGSKRSQAARIVSLMPERCGRYIEPFVGGGSVLYLAAGPGAIAGDIYEPLIELWRMLQQRPDEVVKNYEKQWTLLNQELDKIAAKRIMGVRGLPKYYYSARERFNRDPNPLDLNFLTRTCVNGIIRFNAKGEFNNSFHLSRRGIAPDRFRRVVDLWSAAIQEVVFARQDYRETLSAVRSGDFVYLDPPYAGSRNRYIQNLNLDGLFETLEYLNRKDVKWALSLDGRRGRKDFVRAVPESLYRRRFSLSSGNSPVIKVLNGPVERVHESLYLNY